MRIHDLKCWPPEFRALKSGAKTHEVRVNDRDYSSGDVLNLKCWEPIHSAYSGDEVLALVTNVTKGGTFGLPENVCCMSVRVLHAMDDGKQPYASVGDGGKP